MNGIFVEVYGHKLNSLRLEFFLSDFPHFSVLQNTTQEQTRFLVSRTYFLVSRIFCQDH